MKLKKKFTTIKVLLKKKIKKYIEKVLVSNKISFGEKNYKCFIGYLYNNHKVKPLYIMNPKASASVKIYDGQTKLIYFLIENYELLKQINTIWDKVSVYIKKEFDSVIYKNQNKVSWWWSYRFLW